MPDATQTTDTLLMVQHHLFQHIQRLRTTRWPLKADDEEITVGGLLGQATHHLYLVSYIWYATKENKWEKKKITLDYAVRTCGPYCQDLALNSKNSKCVLLYTLVNEII